jgi:pilus assembly protein Flp/PilA
MVPSLNQQQGARRMSKVFALLKDELGATAIDFGVIAAGISIVIITTVQTVGTQLNTTFTKAGTTLSKMSAETVEAAVAGVFFFLLWQRGAIRWSSRSGRSDD